MNLNKMTVENMTIKDFEKVPHRGSFNKDIGEFDSLVILPTREKHDSGYRCMDFVACIKNKPICRLSGCSDVIHIDGISGYGYNWINRRVGIPSQVEVVGWSVDCLPKSGLLRIFNDRRKMIAGDALSSFEIFAKPKK